MESSTAARKQDRHTARDPFSLAAALAGILFPILLFSGKSLQPENLPYRETTDAAWGRYFAADPGRYRVGFFLEGMAWMLFLVFVLGLAAWFVRRQESDRALAWIFSGAGLVLAAVVLVPFIFRWVLTWDDTLRTSQAPMRVLGLVGDTLNNGAFGFMAFPLVLLTGASGLYMLRTRALPQWVGWFSVVLALINVVHTFEALAPETFGIVHMPGFFGFLLWPILVGASLAVRSVRGDQPAAAVPSAQPAQDAGEA